MDWAVISMDVLSTLIFGFHFVGVNSQESLSGSFSGSIFRSLGEFPYCPPWLPYWFTLTPHYSHRFRHLLFVDFGLMVVLTGMRWIRRGVSVCTSLMTSDPEHLSYTCWPFAFHPLMLDINLLSVVWFTNIFSHSIGFSLC